LVWSAFADVNNVITLVASNSKFDFIFNLEPNVQEELADIFARNRNTIFIENFINDENIKFVFHPYNY
jgi:hypothetical protein